MKIKNTIISKIAGDFKDSPEVMESNISAGAKALIRKAFADVEPSNLVDHHIHILGVDNAQGTSVNRRFLSWLHIFDKIKASVFLNSSGVDNIKHANNQYVQRLVSLIRSSKYHGKYHLLAFDHNYNDDGTINGDRSGFYTSNEYVVDLAKQHPDIFVPVISVHPYRQDAVEELTKWAEYGIKWIKWLPNSQNIDPSSPRIDPYYQAMKKYDMVLLTHTGKEEAIHAHDKQRFGNPLLYKRPLDMGVRIVMAHCASLGKNEDLERPGRIAENFDLFLRMMDNHKYEGLLYGEISAITQFNRLPIPLRTLLKRTDLHKRLINGSDYPLPAINMVIQTRALVKYGMITQKERKHLNEIYSYNPLLFDYVLKRTIKHPRTGKGLDKRVFGGLKL